MDDATRTAILQLAKTDRGTSPEQLEALKRAISGNGPKTHWLTTAAACELLGEPEGKPVSRPYLRNLVREGHLHPKKLSCRKTRYDQGEVLDFMQTGGLHPELSTKSNRAETYNL